MKELLKELPVIIEIDPSSGVCSGVEKAIEKAEEMLYSGKKLYGLGYMVHNENEIERLEKLGMETISHERLSELKGDTILFRAHGEPPESYKMAGRNDNHIIDATCPIVLKLQQKIRKAYEKMDRQHEQIVIFGKADHAETIGLMGQIGGDATVIGTPGEVDRVDPRKKIHLFSQTTMDPEEFSKVETALSEMVLDANTAIDSNCTICGQMKRRKPDLARFAVKHDVIVFVSGKNSSNGKMLYEYCSTFNKNSFRISAPSELDKNWFTNAASVGISGATSTPVRQLESIREAVKDLINS